MAEERNKRRLSRGGDNGLSLETLQNETDAGPKHKIRTWITMAPPVSREVMEVKSVTAHGPPPPPQGESKIEVCNDQLLWCYQKGNPAHGFPCGRLEGSGGGGGEASSSALSAAPVTSVPFQIMHVLLTQWREELVAVKIERASEAPKDADDSDPLSATGR